jgi:signal transduction histidine kinase
MVEHRGVGENSSQAVDLMTAMDRVDDGFLVLDRDWRVRFANAAALRLLGREGGLVGLNIWEEFPTAVGSMFELQYQEALATQRTVEFEEYFELLDAWFSIRAYPSPDGLTLVFRDVTHLHDLLAERHALLDRLLKAEDRERARIAADIHDDTAQALVAIALRLDLLRAQLGSTPPPASALLDELGKLVASATTGLRVLLFGLEPTDPNVPLAESVRAHAAHLFRGSSIRWSVQDVDGGEELPHAERSQALRITKEALNNVHAHAQASEVIVSIRGDQDAVEIVVADDGVALDPAAFTSAPGHRGLATMRDRAAVVGGSCVLEASVPHGCTVRVSVPMARP